ncbi:MAG: universal stress protein [bacterium]
MNTPKKILVPYDFSENSRPALDTALQLALKHEASLLILTVIERTPDDEVLKLIVLPKDLQSRLKQKIHEEIHSLVPEAQRSKIHFEAVVKRGKAPVEILLAAEKEGADLIVMGTKGITGLKHVLLGSVAEKVIRQAGVPVWVCRGSGATLPKKILVPVDFSDYSRDALKLAMEYGSHFGAELFLLHVVDLRDLYAFDLVALETKPSLEDELKKQARERLSQWGKAVTLSHHPEVRLGSPVVEIQEAVRQNQIDLVVLATHGRTGLKHLVMGSVAEQIVRYSPCSVLTVRPSEFFQSTKTLFDGEESFEKYMKSFRD